MILKWFTKPKYRVELFQRIDGFWSWRLRSAVNGQKLATAESYSSHAAARETAEAVGRDAGWPVVHESTDSAPHDAAGRAMACMGVILAACCLLASCGSLKRTALVGGGSALGAAAGSLAGPAGAIGGAAVGGAITSSVVESDAAADRADRLEDRVYPPVPYEPKPARELPHLGWLLGGLWLWLRRAHLADALTGREPRWDAILRALGLRTHKSPRPAPKRREGATATA